jgi:hypothetical protein
VIPFILGGAPGAIDGTLEANEHVALRVRDEPGIWRRSMSHEQD